MTPIILLKNLIVFFTTALVLWFVFDSFEKLRTMPNVLKALVSIVGGALAVGFVLLLSDDYAMLRRLGKIVVSFIESIFTTQWY